MVYVFIAQNKEALQQQRQEVQSTTREGKVRRWDVGKKESSKNKKKGEKERKKGTLTKNVLLDVPYFFS